MVLRHRLGPGWLWYWAKPAFAGGSSQARQLIGNDQRHNRLLANRLCKTSHFKKNRQHCGVQLAIGRRGDRGLREMYHPPRPSCARRSVLDRVIIPTQGFWIPILGGVWFGALATVAKKATVCCAAAK